MHKDGEIGITQLELSGQPTRTTGTRVSIDVTGCGCGCN